MAIKYKGFLSGNALKIIAVVTMLIDHIGALFFPAFIPSEVMMPLRIIGRISMPIFAFLIAEGCRHTKDRKKYFLTVFLLGLVCDIVYYVAMGELYLCILTTFSFSILLIYAYDATIKSIKEKDGSFLYHLICFVAILSLLILAEKLVQDKGGVFDYGTIGAIFPLLCYVFKNRWLRLLMLALGLFAFCIINPLTLQWYSFISLGIIALYSGERGKYNLKTFFYLFYPIHLLALEGIYLLLYYLT